jgi:outer membrane lipoprotein
MDSNWIRYSSLFIVALIMTACASVQPFPVPPGNPPLASVRDNVNAHQNQQVVWGGQILAIEVKQAYSLVTILAKPLDNNGEPVATDKSEGRFLARFSGFRDPAVFASGRHLTVAGTIQGSETRKIGEFEYLYPVVSVTQYRLWPVATTPSYNTYDYWWYDPWYLWYPGYYPYYSHPPQKLPPPTK